MFGFMLRFHLLENFSDIEAGEMDQLYKHEDGVLSPVPTCKSQLWAREMTQWLRSSQEPLTFGSLLLTGVSHCSVSHNYKVKVEG